MQTDPSRSEWPLLTACLGLFLLVIVMLNLLWVNQATRKARAKLAH
jgi:hypothetical protein